MEQVELFCFLDGKHTSFAIDIDRDSSVGALQKAIKHEMRADLGEIAKNRLTLYQVSIPEEAEAIKEAFAAIGKNPRLPQALKQDQKPPLRLLPSLPLSHYFSTGPEKRKVHILVSIAPGEFRDPRPCGGHVAENVLLPL